MKRADIIPDSGDESFNYHFQSVQTERP